MEAYTIILVDDEEEIREGIRKKIDWQSYGFTVVAGAENGEEALELAEKLRPDVVITDIMMPFMDGLDLVENLKKILPSTKVIIFSGFDDLEYAHRAIKLNVFEYALKPVNVTDMGKVLVRLKQQLDQEYESKRDLEILRQHYVESLPVIREQILSGLVEGRIGKEQFERNCAMTGIDIDAKGYTVALLKIDSDIKKLDLFKNHDDALIPIIVKQVADEVMEKFCKCTSFLYEDKIALIASMMSKNDIYQLILGLQEVCDEGKRIYNLILTAGIGLFCENPMDIRYARKEALSALDYSVSIGTGKAIYIGDVEPDSNIFLQFHGPDERAVISAIKMGNDEEIQELLSDIFLKLKQAMASLEQYRTYMMEIKIELIRLIQTYSLPLSEIMEDEGREGMESLMSLQDMENWATQKCLKISHLIRAERVNSSSMLIERAKQYVQERYSDNELTVEMLSQEFHVSPTYFSTLFKRITGSSFVPYLTNIRLEKAVELLNTTDDKSYMIAEKIGYSDPNYFSYVFKKKYGVSPSKFRNS